MISIPLFVPNCTGTILRMEKTLAQGLESAQTNAGSMLGNPATHCRPCPHAPLPLQHLPRPNDPQVTDYKVTGIPEVT